MKSTIYMESNTYLKRSIILLMSLMISFGAWAQSSDKPIPAIKRGKVIALEASANAAQKAEPKAANKREKDQKTDKDAKAGKVAKTDKKKKAKEAATTDGKRYIALKTNVPFLAVALQNLALEMQFSKHISVDLPIIWSISDVEREHAVRTFAVQPEARWWTKGVGQGHFFGVHAHMAWFNLKWEQDRYQTEKRPLLGAGISYGYQHSFSDHWGAEFNIGFGYANMKYNTYYNIENGAKIDTRLRNYWGITRVGLSLVYRF